MIGIYAWKKRLPWSETIPLLLTSVLGAIPVALPATFALASAIGARALAKVGVLPTRLSAVDEAATIDILCSDKTGTLTRNALAVASVHPMSNFDESRVLGLAALASSEGGQDAVDAAIRSASSSKPPIDLPKLTHFVPFDPAKKTSEAAATDSKGAVWKVVKGAFAAVASLVPPSSDQAKIADDLAGQGFRVLALAAGPESAMQLVGLIALSDPPRDDSASLISELKTLGVRTVMVTGDAPATATVVAKAVGLADSVCPPGPPPEDVKPEDFDIYAGILPEGKFNLVKAFQEQRTHRGDVWRRCKRCTCAPAGAMWNRRLDGYRCSEVRRRHRSHAAWCRRYRCGRQRGPDYVSTDSDLYAQLGDQEDRPGVAAWGWACDDWPRRSHAHAHGDRDDYRRFPVNVGDHGSRQTFGNAELVADRQDYRCRCRLRWLSADLLYGYSGFWLP